MRSGRPSQADRVLQHLESGNSITSLSALSDLAIIHLPRRIADLRELGYPIIDHYETVENRYGSKVRVKVYSLHVAGVA
jgi:helix-turn-helix protein